MSKRRHLIRKIAKPIDIEYVGGNRLTTRRSVVLARIEDYENDDGTYRVSIKAREVYETDASQMDDNKNRENIPLKDFLCHRILRLIDRETGEVTHDVSSFFSGLIAEVGGLQPRYWPRPETDPIRTLSHSVTFGPDGFAEGWVFGVCDAFRAALDFRCEEDFGAKRMVWTQGLPPKFLFDVGDIFYSPFPYGESTNRAIQVDAVNDGRVFIMVMTLENRAVTSSERLEVNQDMLAEILRTGNLG